MKEKRVIKVRESRTDRDTKKERDRKEKKRLGLMEKTEQTAVLHIKLAPISRCALRRSLSLSLWSGKMYFSAFYTHVFMKWWEI